MESGTSIGTSEHAPPKRSSLLSRTGQLLVAHALHPENEENRVKANELVKELTGHTPGEASSWWKNRRRAGSNESGKDSSSHRRSVSDETDYYHPSQGISSRFPPPDAETEAEPSPPLQSEPATSTAAPAARVSGAPGPAPQLPARPPFHPVSGSRSQVNLTRPPYAVRDKRHSTPMLPRTLPPNPPPLNATPYSSIPPRATPPVVDFPNSSSGRSPAAPPPTTTPPPPPTVSEKGDVDAIGRAIELSRRETAEARQQAEREEAELQQALAASAQTAGPSTSILSQEEEDLARAIHESEQLEAQLDSRRGSFGTFGRSYSPGAYSPPSNSAFNASSSTSHDAASHFTSSSPPERGPAEPFVQQGIVNRPRIDTPPPPFSESEATLRARDEKGLIYREGGAHGWLPPGAAPPHSSDATERAMLELAIRISLEEDEVRSAEDAELEEALHASTASPPSRPWAESNASSFDSQESRFAEAGHSGPQPGFIPQEMVPPSFPDPEAAQSHAYSPSYSHGSPSAVSSPSTFLSQYDPRQSGPPSRPAPPTPSSSSPRAAFMQPSQSAPVRDSPYETSLADPSDMDSSMSFIAPARPKGFFQEASGSPQELPNLVPMSSAETIPGHTERMNPFDRADSLTRSNDSSESSDPSSLSRSVSSSSHDSTDSNLEIRNPDYAPHSYVARSLSLVSERTEPSGSMDSSSNAVAQAREIMTRQDSQRSEAVSEQTERSYSTGAQEDLSFDADSNAPHLPDEPLPAPTTAEEFAVVATPRQPSLAVEDAEHNSTEVFGHGIRFGKPAACAEVHACTLDGLHSHAPFPTEVELTMQSPDSASFAVEARTWVQLLRFCMWYGETTIKASPADIQLEDSKHADAMLSLEFRQDDEGISVIRLNIMLLPANMRQVAHDLSMTEGSSTGTGKGKGRATASTGSRTFHLPDQVVLPSTLSNIAISLYTLRHLGGIAQSTQPAKKAVPSYHALRSLADSIQGLADEHDRPDEVEQARNRRDEERVLGKLRDRLKWMRTKKAAQRNKLEKGPPLEMAPRPERSQVIPRTERVLSSHDDDSQMSGNGMRFMPVLQ